MRKLAIAVSFAAVALSAQGCIPIALGYAAYEFAGSNKHEADQKTLRMCLQKDAQETDFCKQLLAEESVK